MKHRLAQNKIYKMGTPLKPIRLFLSPKILSPTAPRINTNLQINRNLNVAKRINFKENNANIKLNGRNIKINILGCEDVTNYEIKQSLLVNTPNKLDILKFGLESTSNLNVLGRGTFGTVVRGKYKGEDVAVKVVKTKPRIGESFVLNLKHENIVLVKDVIMQNQSHTIIIMEYLKNYEPLQSVLDDEKNIIYFDKIIKYSLDICNALQFCHDNKILHLDVKPSNVLVNQHSNSCKLCDFGNCAVIGSIEENFKHQGTVIYTAPEILLGKKPTCESDVYSLGILFWQLRYRMAPYYNLEKSDIVIYKVIKFGLRPTCPDIAEIKDDFYNLYQSCWKTIPNERAKLLTVMNILKNISLE